MESAAIEVSEEFEAISARMIGLVGQYQLTFDIFSWKYKTILGEIPDPKVLQAPPEQIR